MPFGEHAPSPPGSTPGCSAGTSVMSFPQICSLTFYLKWKIKLRKELMIGSVNCSCSTSTISFNCYNILQCFHCIYLSIIIFNTYLMTSHHTIPPENWNIYCICGLRLLLNYIQSSDITIQACKFQVVWTPPSLHPAAKI